jgi:hypothetical protein
MHVTEKFNFPIGHWIEIYFLIILVLGIFLYLRVTQI